MPHATLAHLPVAARISSIMRRSSSWRSAFSLSNRPAISRARSTLFSLNRSTTSRATSMRPAAFSRGAMRNATSRRCQRPPIAKFRDFQQRLQPHIHRTPQPLQSKLREHPILAQQRHGIGNRRNGHHFHERHQQPRLIFRLQPPLHQSLRQLERHARAAQIFAGIVASLLVWIHNTQAPAERRPFPAGDGR